MRMLFTGSHRGGTQCMSVSAANVQTSQVQQELGTNGRPAANERVVAARASWAARVSGAGVDGEAVGGEGLMGEGSMPCRLGSGIGHGATVGRRPVPTRARRASRVVVFVTPLCPREMEVA